MELTIDNLPCDLGERLPVLPKYDAAQLADVEACRTGHTVELRLPVTPRNDAVARFARDPHAAERFNSELHTGRLTAGGATLFAGTVRLLAASEQEYRFELRDGGAAWAQAAALAKCSELPVACHTTLIPSAIVESWSDGPQPLRFFPIHRDSYPETHASTDLLPVERILSVDDYLPFLHIATLCEAIFDQTGYRVESRFLQSELFRSLYLSGAYAAVDTAALHARMGFCARRLAPVTAQASPTGRVYADPTAIYNSVGNLVETAAPQSTDADGEPMTDLYNNGNCFRQIDGKIAFVPTTALRVGFDYYLRYTTDHRIESRTRLRGFDSLYLGPGAELRFALPNRYADRRSRFRGNYTYRAIVFDHAAGARYRLTCRNGAEEVTWGDFAVRSARVTSPAGSALADPQLYVADGASWRPYTGDWALYDGYVEETGQTLVELRVSTAAESVSPANPKFFHHIYLFGAEEGMALTLDKRCSLRPIFRSGPGFGSDVTFSDVAPASIRQSELLQAVAHLFNLRFYTDEATRTLYIEPADDFFGAAPEADWSDRTDWLQPIVRRDIAPAIHECRTWCYRAGDGPVKRLEQEEGQPFGSWSCKAESRATLVGEQLLRNPLFAPTLSVAGTYGSAPSALLLQTGDRDDLTQSDSTLTPRIVRYAGLHPLAEGERWGSPAHAGGYPLAAFHFVGDEAVEGFTLCFEDRDGLPGLNRFYRRQTAREGSLERITLTLRCAPHEYEALLHPGSGGPSIRSHFRIDTGHGVVRCLLAAIESYDPAAESLCATFERLPED